MKTIIIDAGCPKTGSSARQLYLSSNEADVILRSNGYVYLDRAVEIGVACDELYRMILFENTDSLVLFANNLKNFDSNIIISHEGISLLNHSKIIKFIKLLSKHRFDIKFFIQVRSIDELMVSWYRQSVINDRLSTSILKMLCHYLQGNFYGSLKKISPAYFFYKTLVRISKIYSNLQIGLVKYNKSYPLNLFSTLSYIGLQHLTTPHLQLVKKDVSHVQIINKSEDIINIHVRAFINAIDFDRTCFSLQYPFDDYVNFINNFDSNFDEFKEKWINFKNNLLKLDASYKVFFNCSGDLNNSADSLDFFDTISPYALTNISNFNILLLTTLFNMFKDERSKNFRTTLLKMQELSVDIAEKDKVIKIFPSFDPIHYLIINPDVFEAGVNAYFHFYHHGQYENRSIFLLSNV